MAHPELEPYLTVQESLRPGRPLALTIGLTNPTGCDLIGVTGELTLEVERGVLISWRLTFRPLPAETALADAVADSEPAFELPLNVAPGLGRARLEVWSADGVRLGATETEVTVAGG